MIRLSDLRGKRVRRETGELLGHVFEIHCEDSRVTALSFGMRGMLQRFFAAHGGHHVLWKQVLNVTKDDIIVSADAPLHPPKRRRRRK